MLFVATAVLAFSVRTPTAPPRAHVVASAADAGPYPASTYDAKAAKDYFTTRPLEVAWRAAQIGGAAAAFALPVAFDYLNGELDSKAEERAKQLCGVLTGLGPTFIKVGQSASVRTDLFPPTYTKALTSLQDALPPFSSDEARAIIASELGMPASSAFARLSPEPIAAASLGQVYRGALPNGTEVAVKVQRPSVERQIALDMLLIRYFAAPLASALGVPGDLVGTADAWGEGFVDELNYDKEGVNAERFNEDVRGTPLEGRIFAPPVVHEASSKKVLTTVWVDGERLDRCSAPGDVPRLCSVAMTAYLEMMLTWGTLHCDPHPGNLLRTSDGKLCILDWGLVTQIESDLQLTLIEHVAHLVAKDYGKVPGDLVRLGFVPEGSEAAVLNAGVVDFLTMTYSTWASGGGAAKMDVPALFSEVRSLAAGTDGGIFQVPPYFAYIAKSFSVLEGIGLSVDAEYSIIDATLPYVSKRILTDPSPRTAGALETFIFGDAKERVYERVLDAERVQTLFEGASTYSNTVAPLVSAASSAPSDAATPADAANGAADAAVVKASEGGSSFGSLDVEAVSDSLFDLLLSKESSPLQEIVLEQLALVIGAATREGWSQLRGRSGSVNGARGERSVLGTLVDPLGLFRNSPLVENDDRDREALAAAAKLAEIARELARAEGGPIASIGAGGAAGGAAGDQPSNEELQRLAGTLSRKLWARREELNIVSRRLGVKLLDQTAQRLRTGVGSAR